MDKMQGGYRFTDTLVKWAYLSKLLSKETESQYRSEQGKF